MTLGKKYLIVIMEDKYQIIDINTKDIVDSNLSYEQALMYIDNCVGKAYKIEPMYNYIFDRDLKKMTPVSLIDI